jgi:flotillin
MVPTIPENKAMVIYGRTLRTGSTLAGYQVITKGGRSPLPIIENVEYMDIGPQNLELDHRDVKVIDGGVDKKASVRVTATVRISSDEDALMVAAEHLLHVSSGDVGRISRNFIEAYLRSVLRTMEIGQAKSDLIGTARKVQQMAAGVLMNIGVEVEKLTILELNLRGG